jgi:hypothetical protein
MTYGKYNYELPHPVPATEEDLHKFIYSRIPFEAFERAEKHATQPCDLCHIKALVGYEFIVSDRTPIATIAPVEK